MRHSQQGVQLDYRHKLCSMLLLWELCTLAAAIPLAAHQVVPAAAAVAMSREMGAGELAAVEPIAAQAATTSCKSDPTAAAGAMDWDLDHCLVRIFSVYSAPPAPVMSEHHLFPFLPCPHSHCSINWPCNVVLRYMLLGSSGNGRMKEVLQLLQFSRQQ